jgi:hypothetical protein
MGCAVLWAPECYLLITASHGIGNRFLGVQWAVYPIAGLKIPFDNDVDEGWWIRFLAFFAYSYHHSHRIGVGRL